MPAIAFFECVRCGQRVSAGDVPTVCPVDAGPLLVRYEADALRESVAVRAASAQGMWRYADVLPDAAAVSLGEGWTPLRPSRRNAAVWVKDEGANPTGSFEDRGMSLAVTMARQYGLRHVAVASAGDAASALAAYAAAAGIVAHVFLPQGAPLAGHLQSALYGADVHWVDGTVSDCARKLGEVIAQQRVDVWFDVSALCEPFRAEGAKTIAYELVEQLGWEFPEAVVYPARDAAGLIGLSKAFEEMERLGWVGGKRPRLYAVEDAAGIVRQSGGAVVAVSDEEALGSLRDWAGSEGLLLSLEGAVGAAVYSKLLASGEIEAGERVVVVNTSSGLKDVESIAKAMRLRRLAALPKSLPVGGIITPV